MESPNDLNSETKVTVAIPCFNSSRSLPRLILSLNRQKRLADEIMIIDDGSTDATKRIAERYSVKVISHEANKGVAHARNTALNNAIGHIIFYLDADTVPDEQCIELILREFKKRNVSAVGGQEFFSDSGNIYDLWRNLFWRQTHGASKIENVWMLMGLCFSFRKNVLLGMGGFNEDYRTNGEDVDIGCRLKRKGLKQVYNPEIGVNHFRYDTFKSVLSMVYRHSFWQSRALRANGINPASQTKKAFRWLIICTGSSFIRHKNIRLILLSIVYCTIAIVGRYLEIIRQKKF